MNAIIQPPVLAPDSPTDLQAAFDAWDAACGLYEAAPSAAANQAAIEARRALDAVLARQSTWRVGS
jgi:hypothetical protein